MKIKLINFTLILFIILISCGKDKNQKPYIDKQDLYGKWVNTEIVSDTLFWSDTIIRRIDLTFGLPKHRYRYEIFEDSITLQYNGEYYILALESTFKINLNDNKSILTIEDINNYFPWYKGDQFIKINN